MDADGVRLAQLLLGSFETLVGDVVEELDRRGHPGVSARLEFALAAIDRGATNASDLGRALGVSRQASAKLVATLEQLGYLERATDPQDARTRQLHVTARGREMMAIGAATFDELRSRWSQQLAPGHAEIVERALAALARSDL